MEQKNGTGAIFKNDKKTQENQPDYQGKIKDLQGKEINLALWVNVSKNGLKYFSVKVSEPFLQAKIVNETVDSRLNTNDLTF